MSTTITSDHDDTTHTRREIAAHFAGHGGPRADGRMRAHLPACASCRRHYDRHLSLARLDPAALSPARRLARGLGIRFAPPLPARAVTDVPPRRRGWGWLVPAALVATVLLFARPWRAERPATPRWSELTARGAPDASPSFWIYRLDGVAPPRLAGNSIDRRDELAFAYSNPTGAAYVMIFGVDELGNVYWFHPGWPAGQAPPGAVAAVAGPGPHELPAAISHRFAGRRLTVHALFLPRPLSTTTVEAELRRRSSGAAAARGDGDVEAGFADGTIERTAPAGGPAVTGARAVMVAAVILGCLRGGTGRAAASTPSAGAPPAPAWAAPAVFALIVGVNASDAPDVVPLQYADDDAARYLDLFRALGANAVILSRLDDNTRRLHPQAAAEALTPSRAELTRAVTRLARDIGQARARGVRTTLYFVYAGHGDGEHGTWSLTLEGGRLTGGELVSELIDRAGADESHLIIDACQAYLLAMPRGPGGTRPAGHGLRRAGGGLARGARGLLAVELGVGRDARVVGVRGGRVQPRGALRPVRRGRRRRGRPRDLRRDRRLRRARQRRHPEPAFSTAGDRARPGG